MVFQLFRLVLFSAHVYGSSQLVGARSLVEDLLNYSTPNTPLIHTSFTYSKLNMNDFSVLTVFLGYLDSTRALPDITSGPEVQQIFNFQTVRKQDVFLPGRWTFKNFKYRKKIICV